MTQIVLDAHKIATAADFYREFATQAKLPAHFGNNLDALWDFLTTELAGAVEIHWQDFSRYSRKQRHELQAFADLLNEAAQNRNDIKVVLT